MIAVTTLELSVQPPRNQCDIHAATAAAVADRDCAGRRAAATDFMGDREADDVILPGVAGFRLMLVIVVTLDCLTRNT